MKCNSFGRLYILASLFVLLSLLQACRWPSSSSGSNTQFPLSDNYYSQADIKQCYAGELSVSAKNKALVLFNDVRRLHGLAELSYDYDSDAMLMESALIMVANRKLQHEPKDNWRCYSELGAQGASHSNIGLYQIADTRSETILAYERGSIKENIVGYMTEIYHVEKGSVGHRLWMLNPFLTQTAYGQVGVIEDGSFISSSALRILYDFNQANGAVAELSTPEQIIAYPYGDYPAEYFDKKAQLSFSILVDAENYMGNVFVDFSQARIEIMDLQHGFWEVLQQDIQFTPRENHTSFAGLPNHIQFPFPELQYNRSYQVLIKQVGVCVETVWVPQTEELDVLQCAAWQQQDYSYSFRIVD